MQKVGFATQELVVGATPIHERTTVQVDDLVRQSPEKGAIMRDEQERLAVAQQVLFHPADGFDVEVVGRLVQQE